MHRTLLPVIMGWVGHFDGVELLLEASLLQVSHEHGQVISGACERRRLVGAARLTLRNLVGRDVAQVPGGLIHGGLHSMQEFLVG